MVELRQSSSRETYILLFQKYFLGPPPSLHAYRKVKIKETPQKELIDPQILIPPNTETEIYRQVPSAPVKDNSTIQPFDSTFDKMASNYKLFSNDVVKQTNQQATNYNRDVLNDSKPNGPQNKMIQLTMGEYQNLLKNHNNIVEGFGNSVDTQLNQLILYIFTGIFFILMMDTMYQLGKKSY